MLITATLANSLATITISDHYRLSNQFCAQNRLLCNQTLAYLCVQYSPLLELSRAVVEWAPLRREAS